MEREEELIQQLKDAILIHGESHKSIGSIYYDLADLYHRRGDLSRAKEFFERSFNIRMNEIGDGCEETIDSFYRYLFLIDGEDASDPEAIISRREQLVEMREKFDSSTSPRMKIRDSEPGNLFFDSTLIYNDIGDDARNAGDYASADYYYLKCIELRRQKYGAQSPALSTVLLNYAQSLQLQEKLSEAEAVMKETLEINTNSFGAFHGSVAEVLNKLGLVYVRQLRFDEAEVALREALRLRQSLFGDLNVIVGSSLNNMAELFREKKDYLTAITYHNNAIEAYEKSVGADHPGTINAKGNLGVTYRRQAREGFEKGELLVKEAVTFLQEHGYDANHPWVVKFDVEDAIAEAQRLLDENQYEPADELLDQLLLGHSTRGGSVTYLSPSQRFIIYENKSRALVGRTKDLVWQGKFDEADALNSEGMKAIITKFISADNPLYAQALLAGASAKAGQGDYAAARVGYLKAMQILTDLLGPDAVQLTEVKIALADLSKTQALYPEAEALYTQSIHIIVNDIQRDPSPNPKPDAAAPILYAKALLGISDLYLVKNSYEAAVSTLSQAILVCDTLTGKNRSLAVYCLQLEAQLHFEKGDIEKAKFMFNKARAAAVDCFGPVHPVIAAINTKLAWIRYLRGELEESVSSCNEVISMLEAFVSPTHESVTECAFIKAVVLTEQADFEAAKVALTECLAIRRKTFGGRHPLVGSTICAIADVLRLRGEPTDAVLLYDDAKKMQQELFDSDGWNYHKSIAAAILGTAKCSLLNGLLGDAVPLVHECAQIHAHLCSTLGCDFTIDSLDTTLVAGNIALETSKVVQSQQQISTAASQLYSILGQQSSRVATAVMSLAQIMMFKGRHKDARILLSNCIAIRIKTLGLKHPDVINILVTASENIRMAGYLADAMCLVAIALTSLVEIFGPNHIFVYQAQIVKARILCDQKKFGDSEILFREIGLNIKSFCGEVNSHYLAVTLGLAEASRRQRAKIANANSKYKEALTTVDVLYGKENLLVVDINCAIAMITFASGKVQDALKMMREDILPQYEAILGTEHPRYRFAQARFGLLLDDVEPGDGDSLRDAAMAYFAQNDQFAYPNDHPWIIELEGYRNKAHAAVIWSSTVIQGLDSWSIPQSKLYPSVSMVQVFIDSMVEAAVEGNLGSWNQMDFQQQLSPDFRHFYLRVFDSSYVEQPPDEPEEVSEPVQSAEVVEIQDINEPTAEVAVVMSDVVDVPEKEPVPVSESVPESPVELKSIPEPEVQPVVDLVPEPEVDTQLVPDASQAISSEVLQETPQQPEASVEPVRDTPREPSSSVEPQPVDNKPTETVDAPIVEALTAGTSDVLPEPEVSIDIVSQLANSVVTHSVEEAVADIISEPTDDVVAAEPLVDTNIGPVVSLEVTEEPQPQPQSQPVENTVPVLQEEKPEFTRFVPEVAPVFVAPVQVVSAPEPEVSAAVAEMEAAMATLDSAARDNLFAAKFMFDRAAALTAMHSHSKAASLLEECLTVREMYFEGKQITIDSKFVLARNTYKRFQWSVCLTLTNSCIDMQVALTGPESIQCVEYRMLLAKVYIAVGKFNEAEEQLEKAVALQTTLFPGKHYLWPRLHCLCSLNALNLDRLQDAEEASTKAYSAVMSAFGGKGVEMANSFICSAMVAIALGKIDEAKPSIEQAVIIRKNKLGDTHPKVADALTLFGVCFFRQGKYSDADAKFELAQTIREKCAIPGNDMHIAKLFNLRAIIHSKFGRFSEALDLLKKSQEIREVLFGARSFSTSESLLSIAAVQTELARFDEAYENVLSAVTIRKELFGISSTVLHSSIADALFMQAEIERRVGHFPEAIELYEVAQDVNQRVFGKASAEYATCEQGVADWNTDQGDYDKAVRLYERVLKTRKAVIGDDHIDYAATLNAYGNCLRLQKKLDKAMPQLEEALKIRKIVFVDSHYLIAETLNNIALTLIAKGLSSSKQGLFRVKVRVDEDLEAMIVGDGLQGSVAEGSQVRSENGSQSVDASSAVGPEDDAAPETTSLDEDNHSASQSNEPPPPQTDAAASEGASAADNVSSLEIDYYHTEYDEDDLPIFPDTIFRLAESKLEEALLMLQDTFPNDEHKHPLIINLEGNFGILIRVEFDVEAQYQLDLPKDDRKAIKARAMKRALEDGDDHLEDDTKAKVHPGFPEIDYAIQLLTDLNFPANHPWLIKFAECRLEDEDTLVGETDEATKTLQAAQDLQKKRRFEESDQLYDDALFMMLEAIGTVGASGNIKAAEIILGKATNARAVGRIAIAQKLYTMTMAICRRSGEGSGEIAAQVFFGLGELLRAKRQCDLALPLYNQAILIMRSLSTSHQAILMMIKVGYARALTEVGSLNEAMEHLHQALQYRESLEPINVDDVAECYVLIGRVHLLRGEFPASLENIDKALAMTRSASGEECLSIAEIFLIRAEYKLQIGKLFDARKEVGKALNLRIKFFGNLQPYAKGSESSGAAINFLHILDDLVKEERAMNLVAASSKLKSLDFWDNWEEQHGEKIVLEDDIDDSTVTSSIMSLDGGEREKEKDKEQPSRHFDYTPEHNVDVLFHYKKVPVTDHHTIVDSLYARGSICYALGDYDESKELLDGCVTMSNNLFGESSAQSARATCIIGLIDFQLGSLTQAVRTLSGALTMRLQLLNEMHPDRVESLVALAMVKNVMCKFEESLDLYKQALDICTSVYGDSHFRTAEVLCGLGDALRSKGDFIEAANNLNTALAVSQTFFGEVHPAIASVLHCLGENAIEQCCYDAAASFFEQALSIRSMLLGDDHPDSMSSLYGVARVHKLKGNVNAFKKSIEECFTMQKKRLGKQHRDAVVSLMHLGYAYSLSCKFSTATPIFERVSFELARAFGNDHAHVAQAFSGMGDNFKSEASFTNAKDCYLKALQIRRRVFGERHPTVADSMHALGEVFLALGYLDDATKHFDDALAVRRLTLGSMHCDIARSFHSIAQCLHQKGRYTDAVPIYQRAISIKNTTLGTAHPDTLDTLMQLSVTLRAMGQLEQASANFSRYLPLLVDCHGSSHPMIARNMFHMGDIANQMALYDDARRWQGDSLEMRRALFQRYPNHPDMQESFFGVAEVLRSKGILTSGIEGTEDSPEGAVFAAKETRVDIENSSREAAAFVNDDVSVGSNISNGSSTALSKLGGDPDPNSQEPVRNRDDEMFALAQYERAVEIGVACFGEEHLCVLKAIQGVAETLKLLGQYREAHSKFKKVVYLARRLYGDEHPVSIEAFAGLGDILRVTSKIYKNEAEFEEASAHKSQGPTLSEHLSSVLNVSSRGVKAHWHPTATLTAAKEGNLKAISSVPPALKKKKAFNATGGYMGYCFPDPKKISSTNVRSVTQPTKIQSTDCKWLYDYGMSVFKKLYGDSIGLSHPLYATLLFGRGELMRARRQTDHALENLDQSLEIRRRLLRGHHPEIADCLNAVAEVHRSDNRFDKAFPLYQIAIEMREAIYGPSHFSVAEIKNNMGIMYYSQGRYDIAEGLYTEALNMRLNTLGFSHPAVAQSLNNLAGLLHAVGRLTEAKPLYLRALDIKKAVFGEKHPDVAQALNNLGLLLKSIGEADEALLLQTKAYDIQMATFGPDHPDVATSLHNLASVYAAKGMRVKARDTYRDAVEVKRKVFGIDHPSVASSLNNLAGLLLTMNELEDARDMYEESLRIRKKVYGEMHPSVAESLNNIGLLLYSQHRYSDAQPLLQRSIQIKKAMFGPRHTITALSLHNYAVLMHKMGRRADAEAAYLEAIDIRSDILGKDHPSTKESQRNLQLLNADKLGASKSRRRDEEDSFNSATISEDNDGLSVDSDFRID